MLIFDLEINILRLSKCKRNISKNVFICKDEKVDPRDDYLFLSNKSLIVQILIYHDLIYHLKNRESCKAGKNELKKTR